MKSTEVNDVIVVVPVYRDVAMTRECVRSAMLGGIDCMNEALMVVIDDASPDSGMFEMLLEQQRLFPDKLVVLRNERNLGFVKTANRGIGYSVSADVVLLNSDVVMSPGWLERLRHDAYSIVSVGTVTPLSNNTTITSFPNFIADNKIPFGLTVENINSAFSFSSLPLIEAPTGVGFCMYIRRACLNDVGVLDEHSFGTGYGEENDFCQRALNFGWKNYISPNLYAFHVGGASFGGERDARLRHAERVLDQRYPNYHPAVQNFVARDELRYARWRRLIDLICSCQQPVVLHVSHGLGGGVAQHLQELAAVGEGLVVSLVLQPEDGGRLLSLGAWNSDESMKILIDAKVGIEVLAGVLKALGLSVVHFHHVMGLSERLLSILFQLPAKRIFTCHDFYAINANPTLTNEAGLFDFEHVGDACSPLYPLPVGVTIDEWRAKFRTFIERCDRVIFPSWSTYDIFRSFFNLLNFTVAPHLEVAGTSESAACRTGCDGELVVGVLGALSREKGAEFLERVAVAAKREKRQIRFVLIGYAFRPLNEVETTGPYASSDVLKLVADWKCDALLFPAVWPETYSYTLSAALASGLPIIAPSIGAFSERLAGRQSVYLFPHPPTVDGFAVQLEEFLLDSSVGQSVSHCSFGPAASGDFYRDQYWKEIGTALPASPRDLVVEKFDAMWRSRSIRSRTGRERILRILWRIYSIQHLGALYRLIPHRFKRAVKRALSKRPMHEVVSRK